jgi:hypothetical protein
MNNDGDNSVPTPGACEFIRIESAWNGTSYRVLTAEATELIAGMISTPTGKSRRHIQTLPQILIVCGNHRYRWSKGSDFLFLAEGALETIPKHQNEPMTIHGRL